MNYLVTAIGSMSAEAVIARLKLIPDAEIIGCDIYPREWLAASRLVKRCYRVPYAHDEDEYVRQLLHICESERIGCIIVLTDPEVDVLASHREAFAAIGSALSIPPIESVQKARDKLAIYQCFADHPHIQPIETFALEKFNLSGRSSPWIAKPRKGRSSEGQVHIPDADALDFWKKRLAGRDYVVQPFYPGDVLVADVVRHPDSGTSIAMVRQELLRTKNGAGMTVRMLPDHICADQAIEVADILGLQGCVNIEFLVADGRPLLMDVNPRFSAGVCFSVRAGYDMVLNHLRCFGDDLIDPFISYDEEVYVRGFVEYSIKDEA